MSLARNLSLLAALVGATSAHAQNFQLPPGTTPSIQVCGLSPDITSCGGSQRNYIPLSAFATDAELEAVRQAVEARFAVDRTLSGGVAMSSAIDFQMPADGTSNRLGGGVATFNNEAAVGITYSRRDGRWDSSVGLATSSYDAMAKASFGFSW